MSDSKKYVSVIKGLNIATIVIASLLIVLSLFFLGLSYVVSEAFNTFGGIDSFVEEAINDSGEEGALLNKQVQEFSVTAGHQYTSKELTSTIVSAAYIVFVVYALDLLILDILEIIFAAIILARIRKKDRARSCLKFAIFNSVLSFLSLNFVSMVFGIVSSVLIHQRSKA